MSRTASYDESMYTQTLFRALLDGMARPGKVQSMEAPTIPSPYANDRFLIGILLTLLDQEVTLAMDAAGTETSQFVQLYTLARRAGWESCDFAVIDGASPVDLTLLKRGTFTFPDESATVICRAGAVSDRLEGARSLTAQGGADFAQGQADQPGAGGSINQSLLKLNLAGPGIKDSRTLYLYGIKEQFITQLQVCNMEFPLGIDLILYDGDGRLCCIPRTTQIRLEGK